jgi:hypothetical protein
VNWDQYLVLAQGLARHPFEASERSAISRAYYASFNVSRRWLEANVTPIDNRGAHGQVWQTFRTAEHANPASRKAWILVGRLGDALRVLRNEADYADRIELGPVGALRAVANAERILELLPELELAD